MNLLLADAGPNAKQAMDFFSVGGWLLGGLAAIATIATPFIRDRKREIGPQPFSIKMHEEFTSKSEFQRMVERNQTEHDNIFKKVGGMERGVKDHADKKVEKLQESVNEIGLSVAGLDEKTNAQNEWLKRIDEKLDDLQKDKNDNRS